MHLPVTTSQPANRFFSQILTQTYPSGTLQSEDRHHELQGQGVQNDVRKEGHGTSRHHGVAVHAEVARLAVGLESEHKSEKTWKSRKNL